MSALQSMIGAPVGWTYCSGIGAPELAADWVDWRLASEIEPFPREVLRQRFGYLPPGDHNQGDPLLWGDFTEVTPQLARDRGVPLPNLVVAGTPCQAFSVAGLRKGVHDARGNLTLKFVENIHDLVAARPDGKLAVVWENVPGVLSDKGNAFGCFLGGLVGALDALQPPGGGSWPGEGMVQGPRARAAWAVLDAQWFGVAQRRRRVFVVVDFGGCIDPAAILLEPDRLRGDLAPRRKTGEGVAPAAGLGLENGSLRTGIDTDAAGVVSGPNAETLQTTCGDYSRADGLNMVAHSLRAQGHLSHRADQDNLVPVVGALCKDSFAGGAGGRPEGAAAGHFIPVAFDCKGTEVQFTEDDTHPTLRSMGGRNGCASSGGHAAVAFDLRGRDGGAMPEGPHETAAIRAASGGSSRSYIAHPWAVRRLLPIECERLQGQPDGHTLIPWRAKPASQCPDGPRYKALGNSMAVPVVGWILNRVRISAGWAA